MCHDVTIELPGIWHLHVQMLVFAKGSGNALFYIIGWIGCDLEEVEFAEEDDRKKADNEETDSEDPDHWWAAFPNRHPVGGEDIDE